ncbi:DUF1217 domain-containing protein [Lichenihabitans sp. Uapishka_5]|uniref:DUF1217 domain-containing protein n=1 Tax=Lichenihabitans sp. Uapishka_5 TaxID=3037302 RepID=UPI0029E7D67F|nr:DUF1217 domain-containing protein [Lichenihabitans sp. Uapishka_5]MDX7953839.1 DUF1217 domain-containing protein [Lichenihabitans sp. Uapishka_5]
MTSSTNSTYLDYQLYAGNMAKSLNRVASEPTVKSAQAYYTANIGKVKTADDFLNNYKLFSYAMQASGLKDMTYAKAFMRKVLTSDLSDSSSFVNKLTDPRFKDFAEKFSFTTKGTATSALAAQSTTQQSRTIALYTAKAGSSIDATLATAYYQSNIGSVKSVQDLESNSQLLDYVMTAYGLDGNTIENGSLTASTAAGNDLAAALESDPSDPGSVANQMAAGVADTSNIPLVVQSAANQEATSTAYSNTYGRTTDLIHYENTIGTVHSLDSFLADPKLVSVAGQAYGLDTSSYSTTDMKRILSSNLDDPYSVANMLGSKAVAFAKAFSFATSADTTSPYTALSQDFNFDTNGKAASIRTAQATVDIANTETLYMSKAKSDKVSQAAAKSETTYYTTAIAGVKTLDDLLSDSRMVSYIKTAYGFDPKTSTTTLRQILTSDLTNPKSVANQMGTAARRLTESFNISKTGTLERSSTGAQSAKSVQAMNDAYLETTLEDEAGDQSAGVKLALYFQNKVTTGAVTSAYSILADSALLKVVQTALSIPSSTSNQDIDTQANRINSRLKLSDLQNPAKMKSFISQFATLYDLANTSSNSDTITTLFG